MLDPSGCAVAVEQAAGVGAASLTQVVSLVYPSCGCAGVPSGVPGRQSAYCGVAGLSMCHRSGPCQSTFETGCASGCQHHQGGEAMQLYVSCNILHKSCFVALLMLCWYDRVCNCLPACQARTVGNFELSVRFRLELT